MFSGGKSSITQGWFILLLFSPTGSQFQLTYHLVLALSSTTCTCYGELTPKFVEIMVALWSKTGDLNLELLWEIAMKAHIVGGSRETKWGARAWLFLPWMRFIFSFLVYFFLVLKHFPNFLVNYLNLSLSKEKIFFLLHMKKYHFVCLISMGATFQRMRKANTPKITFLRPFFE